MKALLLLGFICPNLIGVSLVSEPFWMCVRYGARMQLLGLRPWKDRCMSCAVMCIREVEVGVDVEEESGGAIGVFVVRLPDTLSYDAGVECYMFFLNVCVCAGGFYLVCFRCARVYCANSIGSGWVRGGHRRGVRV